MYSAKLVISENVTIPQIFNFFYHDMAQNYKKLKMLAFFQKIAKNLITQ